MKPWRTILSWDIPANSDGLFTRMVEIYRDSPHGRYFLERIDKHKDAIKNAIDKHKGDPDFGPIRNFSREFQQTEYGYYSIFAVSAAHAEELLDMYMRGGNPITDRDFLYYAVDDGGDRDYDNFQFTGPIEEDNDFDLQYLDQNLMPREASRLSWDLSQYRDPTQFTTFKEMREFYNLELVNTGVGYFYTFPRAYDDDRFYIAIVSTESDLHVPNDEDRAFAIAWHDDGDLIEEQPMYNYTPYNQYSIGLFPYVLKNFKRMVEDNDVDP